MTEVQVAGSPGLQGTDVSKPITSAARAPTLHSTQPYDDHSSQSSVASQLSAQAPLKLSPTDVSRTALPAPIPEDLTPPSSTASPSRDHEPSTNKVAPNGDRPSNSTTQSARGSRSPSTSGSQSEGATSTKRTASGRVKIHQHVESGIDSDKTDTRYLRASSSVSTASTSNVTEIGQQLRTRLKYAMVKVQNGWQTRSLDELESIASASPKSHASPFVNGPDHRSPFSSQGTKGSTTGRKWSDSTSSESSRSEPRLTALTSVDGSRISGQPGRTLGPPVDIVPGSRRRPTPNGTTVQPPMHRAYHSRPTSQRTPSQNAAMEADAVETLLFMASPNNSGYHPPSQASQESSLRTTLQYASQTSPLRTQFSQTSVTSPKRVAFSDQAHPTLPATKSELIDNMINSIPDESDSELDAALNLADQRRAGKLPA